MSRRISTRGSLFSAYPRERHHFEKYATRFSFGVYGTPLTIRSFMRIFRSTAATASDLAFSIELVSLEKVLLCSSRSCSMSAEISALSFYIWVDSESLILFSSSFVLCWNDENCDFIILARSETLMSESDLFALVEPLRSCLGAS